MVASQLSSSFPFFSPFLSLTKSPLDLIFFQLPPPQLDIKEKKIKLSLLFLSFLFSLSFAFYLRVSTDDRLPLVGQPEVEEQQLVHGPGQPAQVHARQNTLKHTINATKWWKWWQSKQYGCCKCYVKIL